MKTYDIVIKKFVYCPLPRNTADIVFFVLVVGVKNKSYKISKWTKPEGDTLGARSVILSPGTLVYPEK